MGDCSLSQEGRGEYRRSAQPETFSINGPDNEVLKTWKIDDNGETNDDAGLQIRCSTVRVPRSPVVGGTKEPGDESRSSDECVREWADPGQPGRKLGVEMMAFRQYFWVDVANRGLTTVVPHEHFEWQI